MQRCLAPTLFLEGKLRFTSIYQCLLTEINVYHSITTLLQFQMTGGEPSYVSVDNYCPKVYLMTQAGGVSLFENISVLVEAVETIS